MKRLPHPGQVVEAGPRNLLEEGLVGRAVEADQLQPAAASANS
jgi:hypothetical protein